MQNFRNVDVWRHAHEVALAVYRATESFPSHELYGLTSQIRRCATSIPTNIAEGCGRGSDPDFRRFLQTAMGSASELEYLILLSEDLRLMGRETAHTLTKETQRTKKMLASFIRRLGQDIRSITTPADSR